MLIIVREHIGEFLLVELGVSEGFDMIEDRFLRFGEPFGVFDRLFKLNNVAIASITIDVDVHIEILVFMPIARPLRVEVKPARKQDTIKLVLGHPRESYLTLHTDRTVRAGFVVHGALHDEDRLATDDVARADGVLTTTGDDVVELRAIIIRDIAINLSSEGIEPPSDEVVIKLALARNERERRITATHAREEFLGFFARTEEYFYLDFIMIHRTVLIKK